MQLTVLPCSPGACLIKAESSRDTGKVSKPNRNKSVDYGLFQINDKYWCSNTGTAGKDCHVTCRGKINSIHAHNYAVNVTVAPF